MAEIFISYAEEDRGRVELLAEALKKQGWTVFWDRTIRPGKSFDEVIPKAIEEAKCVVVVWSENSIKSDWVKEELYEGQYRNKAIVPARIENVIPPFGFKRMQAADLTDWEMETDHFELKVFLGEIANVLEREP